MPAIKKPPVRSEKLRPLQKALGLSADMSPIKAVAKTPAPDPLEGMRLLRMQQVLLIVPLSRSRIRQLESEGRFPRRIALGDAAVAWRAADIAAWIEQRVEGGNVAPKGAAQPSGRKGGRA